MHSGLQRLPRRQTRAAEPAATIASIGLIVATIGDYRDYHDYRDYRTVATIAGGYRARRKSWRYLGRFNLKLRLEVVIFPATNQSIPSIEFRII